MKVGDLVTHKNHENMVGIIIKTRTKTSHTNTRHLVVWLKNPTSQWTKETSCDEVFLKLLSEA
jgi:hypothetical protein